MTKMREIVEILAGLPVEQCREIIAGITPHDMLKIDAEFDAWAHEGQRPPPGDGWRTWLMLAGRGYGKTRAGAEWVHSLAMRGGPRRFALVAASIDEARQVMVEGKSGLLAVSDHQGGRIRWEPSLSRLTWGTGSVAHLFSAENPDGLRGPEHHFAWCDELAKWRRAEETWDNLQFGLRAGMRPRALITTTPQPIALFDRLRAEPWTVETGGATGDNINLPERFVEIMTMTYGGTRIGRQELNGELLSEAPGSLFPRALIERCRVEKAPERFERIVVGVDPPAGESSDSDACGIVVAGRSAGQYYVLADATVQGTSPERWAQAVAGAAEVWNASKIIAEANQGGAMVRSVLRNAGVPATIELVHARQGKAARAEPIATLFEAGRAFVAGSFAKLEAELAGLAVAGRYSGPGRSPDRADAMVWALTALSDGARGLPRVVVF